MIVRQKVYIVHAESTLSYKELKPMIFKEVQVGFIGTSTLSYKELKHDHLYSCYDELRR